MKIHNMDNKERDFYKKYREEHYCCPKCHSKFYSSTLAAYCLVPGHEDEYKDCNSVECFVCGWEGITHELKPKPKKIGYKIGLYDYEHLVIPYEDKIYDTKEDAKKHVDELSKQKRADGYYYTYYEIEIKEDKKDKLEVIEDYINNRKKEIWNSYGTLNEIKGNDLIEFKTLSKIENIIKYN